MNTTIDKWDLRDLPKVEKFAEQVKAGISTEAELQVVDLLSDCRFPHLFTLIDLVEALSPEAKSKLFKNVGWRLKRFLPEISDLDTKFAVYNTSFRDQLKRFVKVAVETGVYQPAGS